MERTQSSNSDAISKNQSYGSSRLTHYCYCGKTTKVAKSWTDENPGRRFMRCETHGFSRWLDEEKPHGWQKVMLLESREEIKLLKDSIRNMKNAATAGVESQMPVDAVNDKKIIEKLEKEVNNLENEVMVGQEREKLMRQFIVLSWGGFIAMTTIIISMVRK